MKKSQGLYWFEEVRFDGREIRAVMDSERERIQDLCSRETIAGENTFFERYVLRLVLKAGMSEEM